MVTEPYAFLDEEGQPVVRRHRAFTPHLPLSRGGQPRVAMYTNNALD